MFQVLEVHLHALFRALFKPVDVLLDPVLGLLEVLLDTFLGRAEVLRDTFLGRVEVLLDAFLGRVEVLLHTLLECPCELVREFLELRIHNPTTILPSSCAIRKRQNLRALQSLNDVKSCVQVENSL